jgi:hypothetical protein
VKIVEYTEGHYEVEDVEFGKVYAWRPEHVAAECECGEKLDLSVLEATCGRCGADHAAVVQEELAGQYSEDETLHPWRYWRTSGNTGLPI